MKKGKLGFTLVEVSLFLAITAALFVGVTVGVQNSINNQRYNDSVQSYIEFLRNVYAQVANVQNDTSGGDSNKAIHGKLVTFGENTDLTGNPVGDPNTIFTYTVVGRVLENSESGTAISLVNKLGGDISVVTESGGVKKLALTGFPESYLPKWDTQIETKEGERLSGMLLIVRHPNSGVIYTYFRNTAGSGETGPNQINKLVKNKNSILGSGSNTDTRVLNLSGFSTSQVDFCVHPSVNSGNRLRSDVRIVRNARNASGIELIPEDDASNQCK